MTDINNTNTDEMLREVRREIGRHMQEITHIGQKHGKEAAAIAFCMAEHATTARILARDASDEQNALQTSLNELCFQEFIDACEKQPNTPETLRDLASRIKDNA